MADRLVMQWQQDCDCAMALRAPQFRFDTDTERKQVALTLEYNLKCRKCGKELVIK